MDEKQINELIAIATDVVSENGENLNHTVGSAVATKDGKVISGVNFYHFNGGPCAEVVTMANAISQGEKELTCIVAVGDRDRGILAPCGRCRQTIFDYYPEMQVVLKDGNSSKVVDIKELLPETYSQKDNE